MKLSNVSPALFIAMVLFMPHSYALSWIEKNQGQLESAHQYIVRSNDLTALVDNTYLDLIVTAGAPVSSVDKFDNATDYSTSTKQKIHRARLSFVGANTNATFTTNKQLKGVSNYFSGSDSNQWVSKVPHFSEIGVTNVYPGIDVVYRLSEGQLEYDFIVAPDADPAQITLHLDGVSASTISTEGQWHATTPYGDLIQSIPAVYQIVDGQKTTINGDFHALQQGAIGFKLAGSDASATLVIDPVIEFSGYFGGNRTDTAYSMQKKQNGNYVIGGVTTSLFDAIADPSELTINQDIYAAEISADDGEIVWFTVFGGSLTDTAERIQLDANDEVVFVGFTASPDFPTVNAFQSVFADNGSALGSLLNGDGIVAKLTTDGSDFVFSTYLGGEDAVLGVNQTFGFEIFRGLDFDSDNNIYVAGQTAAADFPVTHVINGFACYEQELDPNVPPDGGVTSDIAFAKFSPTGERLFSACIGGNSRDAGRGVLVDDNDKVHLVGFGRSPNFPTTTGAFQPSPTPDAFTPFVLRLSTDLTSIEMSTFIAEGFIWEVDVDSAGNVYGVADTLSDSNPTTPNAFQSTFSDAPSAFDSTEGYVFKLSADGTELLYATYLGAVGDDQLSSIKVDDQGRAYVSGKTNSPAYPRKNSLILQEEAYLSNSDLWFPSNGYNHISRSRLENTNNFLSFIARDGGNLLAIGDNDSFGQVIPFAPFVPTLDTAAMASFQFNFPGNPIYVMTANRDGLNRLFSINEQDFNAEFIADVGLASDDSRALETGVFETFGDPTFVVANYGKRNTLVQVLPGDPVSTNQTEFGRIDGNTTAFVKVGIQIEGVRRTFLAVANEFQDLRLYSSDGTTITPIVMNYSASAITDLSAGDLDGDGTDELVVASSDRAIEVLYFDDLLNLTNLVELEKTGSGNLSVLVVDVDDDSDLDIIVGRTTEDKLYLNDGLGNFVVETSYVGSAQPTKSLSQSVSNTIKTFFRPSCPCYSVIEHHPQEIRSSSQDIVLSVLNADGSDLEYSQRLTGGGDEGLFLGMDFVPGSDSKVMLSGSSTGDNWIQFGTSRDRAEGQDSVFMVIEIDQDQDDALDGNDNCLLVANQDQRDTNGDGFGNICDADLNNDNIINFLDVNLFRLAFLSADADADFDGNGVVNFLDFVVLSSSFLQRPGPGLGDLAR